MFRSGLAQRIFAVVLLVIAVPIVALAIIAGKLQSEVELGEERARLDYGKTYLESLVKRRIEMLASRMAVLVDDPRLVAALPLPASAPERSALLLSLEREYGLSSLGVDAEDCASASVTGVSFVAESDGISFMARERVRDVSGGCHSIAGVSKIDRSVLDEFRIGLDIDIEIRSYDPSVGIDRIEFSTRFDVFGLSYAGMPGRPVPSTYLQDLAGAGTRFEQTEIAGEKRIALDFPFFANAEGPYVASVSRTAPVESAPRNAPLIVAFAALGILLAALAAAILSLWIADPVVELAFAMDGLAGRMAAGMPPVAFERKRSDEIGALREAYNRMTQDLVGTRDALDRRDREYEDLDRLKDELLATTSHELRTPLAAIVGLAETMSSDGELPERFRGVSVLVGRTARRLSSLVDDIMDYARLRKGTLAIQSRRFDLSLAIDSVVSSCSPLARAGVELRAVLPRPAMARGDAGRVEQILTNLVTSALKFTERGRVSIELSRERSRWVVRVRDTGVLAERLETGFGRYFSKQGGGANVPADGAGLGLAVASRLAELHGGSLRVESNQGADGSVKGAVASFDLAAADDQA